MFISEVAAGWRLTLHMLISEVECYVSMMKNRKIKTYSKTRASQNILCINAIVYYYSSFVLFLKTCTHKVSSVVIFHVQIE